MGSRKDSWRTWFFASGSAAAKKLLPSMIAWFQISMFFKLPSANLAERASIVGRVSDPGPPRLIQSPGLTISAHFLAVIILFRSFCCTGVDIHTLSLFAIFC